jgi:hypothetical protein
MLIILGNGKTIFFSCVDLFLDSRNQNLTLPMIAYYSFLKIRLVCAYVLLRVLECCVAPTFIWTELLVAWKGKEGRTLNREEKYLARDVEGLAPWDSFRSIIIVIPPKPFFGFPYKSRWDTFTWKLRGNSDFQSYCPVMKPTLPKIINGQCHVTIW